MSDTLRGGGGGRGGRASVPAPAPRPGRVVRLRPSRLPGSQKEFPPRQPLWHAKSCRVWTGEGQVHVVSLVDWARPPDSLLCLVLGLHSLLCQPTRRPAGPQAQPTRAQSGVQQSAPCLLPMVYRCEAVTTLKELLSLKTQGPGRELDGRVVPAQKRQYGKKKKDKM